MRPLPKNGVPGHRVSVEQGVAGITQFVSSLTTWQYRSRDTHRGAFGLSCEGNRTEPVTLVPVS